jgi:uncharacterized OB-fold protein
VDYLVLAPEPHLVASQCDNCAARFLVARAACAQCGRRELSTVRLPVDGSVRTYSVVRRAPHDALVPAPYLPAVVQLSDGTSVSTCLVDMTPDEVSIGMAVQLTTVELADGPSGEVTSFGFRAVGA